MARLKQKLADLKAKALASNDAEEVRAINAQMEEINEDLEDIQDELDAIAEE